MATKKEKGIADTVTVIFDDLAIAAAKASIISYSKKLEGNIDLIGKEISKFKDNWDSVTANYYQTTVSKKVAEIQSEQNILYANLNKYLSSVVKQFEMAEKSMVKNADLFK